MVHEVRCLDCSWGMAAKGDTPMEKAACWMAANAHWKETGHEDYDWFEEAEGDD